MVLHPGSHRGAGTEAGIRRVAEALRASLDRFPDGTARILLENTAGQGATLGRAFEELREMLDLVDAPDRLGVCLDTCHLFAAGYELRTLRVSGIKGRGAPGRILAALAAGWALFRCVAWMLRRRPDLVVGVGGYASGPAVLAASLLKVRAMVMEQNHYPGATNRWLAPRVDAVCLPSEAARERLGGRGEVTGNPVRPEFREIGEPEIGALLTCGVDFAVERRLRPDWDFERTQTRMQGASFCDFRWRRRATKPGSGS